MNMRTYNGISYEAWYYSQLQPTLDVKDNMVVTGLGYWIDHTIANTWRQVQYLRSNEYTC